MLTALRHAVDAAVADLRVFVIAITGEGRAFYAGIDISLLQRDAARAGTGKDRPTTFAEDLRAPRKSAGQPDHTPRIPQSGMVRRIDRQAMMRDGSSSLVFQ
ncbi:hypothetical protein GCM10019059_43330 [Camelimonas fluminis]|nr:hypothetical protein GCM10019059_43330 [Camelimonas fluminis]